MKIKLAELPTNLKFIKNMFDLSKYVEKEEHSMNIPETFVEERNFEDILKVHNIKFKKIGYHLSSKDFESIEGWVLHISVVISNLTSLLIDTIPFLLKPKMQFRIPADKFIAKNILDGHLGYYEVGKIISIYNENATELNSLVNNLIKITKSYKGPAIPEAIHLGGLVYCSYKKGLVNQNIYLKENRAEISNEKCLMLNWPFEGIEIISPPKENHIFKGTYKRIEILKSDARGNVFKCLYLKKGFIPSYCVVKQGKMAMCSDDEGRDIQDRIIWQKQLHDRLRNIIPLPKVIELFSENNDIYFVIDFIKGPSLHKFFLEKNKQFIVWDMLALKEKFSILNVILDLIELVKSFHENDVVHRDITVENFLVKGGKCYPIDIELSYSFEERLPNPPFQFGTHGFMSPEQLRKDIPTKMEDIYGLSATMLYLLTGIFPTKIYTGNHIELKARLIFFIGHEELANIIALGLHHDPQARPKLSSFTSAIRAFMEEIAKKTKADFKKTDIKTIQNDNLSQIINKSLKSLCKPPMVLEDLWVSKDFSNNEKIRNEQKAYTVYPWLQQGISGVIYTLSKAKIAGYDIGNCLNAYRKGIDFIQDVFLKELPNASLGLYDGSAGACLAISAGLKAGLLRDRPETRGALLGSLTAEIDGFDIFSGSSGQGIAILLCKDYLPIEFLKASLDRIKNKLLKSQQIDGSWFTVTNGNVLAKRVSFEYGVAGILYFLLEYCFHFGVSDPISSAIKKGIEWLTISTDRLNFNKDGSFFTEEELNTEGVSGIFLTFIRANKLFKDDPYKLIVEKAIEKQPDFIVHNNFSQSGGLSQLGELYLELWREYKDEKWKKRAEWIAEVLLHGSFESDEDYYWLLENGIQPTADFMKGNSGIIHFLIRIANPDLFGYPIISNISL